MQKISQQLCDRWLVIDKKVMSMMSLNEKLIKIC